jgi:transcription initiation factor IIE alpha subunit
MNRRILNVDLIKKKSGLRLAEATLEVFLKAKPLNKKAIAEVQGIIRELKRQIKEIEENIKRLDKNAKKKT